MAVLGLRLGTPFLGVANLWIAILLGSLARLRNGGAFALVVPTKSLTGVSAASARRWLLENTTSLQVDLFEPGCFPGVLQQVMVMSGRRVSASELEPRQVTFVEHVAWASAQEWSHLIRTDAPWTRYLLTPDQLDAVDSLHDARHAYALGNIASLEVAAVTGANEFFTVDVPTADQYELSEWAIPALARIRHAPGLVFRRADYEAAAASGTRVLMLDFSAARTSPEEVAGAARYLAAGRRQGLHLRFKTRIRTPWYRVPHIRPGRVMLSKRSASYPRLILNELGAVTTDAISTGAGFARRPMSERDLVAAFHSSLTLLSCELEGRSFGGGVLELVPSEIARLSVVVPPGFGDHLDRLDDVARSSGSRWLQTSSERLTACWRRLVLWTSRRWSAPPRLEKRC